MEIFKIKKRISRLNGFTSVVNINVKGTVDQILSGSPIKWLCPIRKGNLHES